MKEDSEPEEVACPFWSCSTIGSGEDGCHRIRSSLEWKAEAKEFVYARLSLCALAPFLRGTEETRAEGRVLGGR